LQKINVAALLEELARPDLSFEDRAFLTEQLTAYERLITENPLQRYIPHPKQVRFHTARTTIKAFLGGNRSGKTTAGIVDDLIQAVDEGCLPAELREFKKWQPPFFCRILTPDFTSTMEGVVFEAIREWVPRSQLKGGGWDKAYNKQLRRLDFKNGSVFEFMTYEQALDKFGGAARIHFDSPPQRSVRSPLRRGASTVEARRSVETARRVQDSEWASLLGISTTAATRRCLHDDEDSSPADDKGRHVAAPHRNLNPEVHPEPLLELIGWTLSDGSVVKNANKIVVYQSITRYPENCARIELLLHAAGAQFHYADRPYPPAGRVRRFVITGDIARQIRWLVGSPKRLRPEFVASLGERGAMAVLRGLLDGDGCRLPTRWEYTSVDRDLADGVAMLAVITGHRANVRSYEQRGKPVYKVKGLTGRDRVTDFKRRTEPTASAGVWCPQTTNGTWVARRNGTAFITGNTWMFDDVYEKRYEPNVTVVEVATDENPHINKEAMEEFFATLTPEEVEARRKGRFVHFGGLVLAMFDDDESLVDELVPNHHGDLGRPLELKGQEILVGIDPGIVRGGVVWVAVDRDQHMLVFHELYPKNQTVPQIAADIKAVNAYYGIRDDEVTYIIDPSGRNRALTNAINVQTEFSNEGIPTVPGQNDRVTGVLQLRRRLTARPAALKVTRNCLNWLREKGRWRVSEDEETSEDKAEGDSFKTAGPDHLMDPTRYVAMARVWGPALDDFMRRRRSAYQPNYEPPWEPDPPMHGDFGPMGSMS
jgi:hypothetical protein